MAYFQAIVSASFSRKALIWLTTNRPDLIEAYSRFHSKPAPVGVRPNMRIILAQPRGFCAGVVRAIEIVDRALQRHGAPVYVRHEIVHNRHVVENLRSKGARFVEELDEVPHGAVAIFSAHGVAQSVERDAEQRGLDVPDTPCPPAPQLPVQGPPYDP